MSRIIENKKSSPLFVFPDPVTSSEELSGACFLYFEKPLVLSLPPVVIEEGSYSLINLIEERRPDWGGTFMRLFGWWRHKSDMWTNLVNLLAPLKNKVFKVMWLVYPANSAALEDSKELVTSTGLSIKEVADMINPHNAAGELMRHILLESYLELGKDIDSLFDYCGKFFSIESLSNLLVRGYFLRMPMLAHNPDMPILLTNERLIRFLESLPIENIVEKDEQVENDIIAWEFFRQILSPRLDPLNEKRVEFILNLLENRKEEIERVGMSDPLGHLVLFFKVQKGGLTCAKTISEMPLESISNGEFLNMPKSVAL